MLFESQDNSLSIYIMFSMIGLLIWVYSRDRSLFAFKWRMLMSSYEAEHYFRTNEGKMTFTEILLSSLFCLVLSLFGLRFFNQGILQDFYFIYIAILIFVIYQLKIWSIKFFGFLTGRAFEFDFYKYNTDLVYKMLGLFLLPVLVFVYLSDDKVADLLLAVFPLLILIAVFFKFIKMIQIVNKHLKFYKIYFFIYFCTLEILPNLVLIKAIFEKSNIYG